MDLQQSSTRWRVWSLVYRNVRTRSVRSSLLFWLLVQALVSSLCLQEASTFVLRKASFVAYKVVALFVPHRVFALFLSHRVFALFLLTVSFLKDVWTNTRVLSRSGGSYKMSEFRQETRLPKKLHHSLPSTSYLCPNKTEHTIKTQWRRWR